MCLGRENSALRYHKIAQRLSDPLVPKTQSKARLIIAPLMQLIFPALIKPQAQIQIPITTIESIWHNLPSINEIPIIPQSQLTIEVSGGKKRANQTPEQTKVYYIEELFRSTTRDSPWPLLRKAGERYMEMGEAWCRPLWNGCSGWVYEVATPGGPAAATELSEPGEELHTEPTIHPNVRDHIQGVHPSRPSRPPRNGAAAALLGRMMHTRLALRH